MRDGVVQPAVGKVKRVGERKSSKLSRNLGPEKNLCVQGTLRFLPFPKIILSKETVS